ncbi:hypothetical protein CRYUN_Cryun05aG0066800 [Craigia yunnanensis]
MIDVLVSSSANTTPTRPTRKNTNMAQVTTSICNVKNITSSTLIYQMSNDWQGAIGAGGLGYYPKEIKSRVTDTFQHVGNQNGSQGAVVYRITISPNENYDVMVAWFNQPNSPNKAYTLVDQAGSFTTDRWAAIFNALINSESNSSSTLGAYTSKVEIGDGNFPTVSATISAA